MTWQASQRFEAGDFKAAELAYRDILKEFPEDALANSMISECAKNKRPILPMPGSAGSNVYDRNLAVAFGSERSTIIRRT
jgi:hypothetical protein